MRRRGLPLDIVALSVVIALFVALIIWMLVFLFHKADECDAHGGVLVRGTCIDRRAVIPLP